MLAERTFADVEQQDDSPDSLIETLHDDIHDQILVVVGESNKHHKRYHAAYLRLLGRERVLRR